MARSIFEEVGDTKTSRPAAQPGGIDRRPPGARKSIRNWLLALFALLVVMIAVGGLTRLTDSGLSITEWAPISGALPPLNAEDWQAEFAAYQQTTEFQQQNSAMTLAEFKSIYWWEWGHRQLGRIIGLVWAAGFAWFALRRQIPPGWTGRLLLLGFLGGLQGAIGWWMVQSGLRPGVFDVASYRLAIHLGLAFAILGLIAWYAFLLSRRDIDLMQSRRSADTGLVSIATWIAALAFVQILLGALVAGIDAGRSYPTWPLMGDSFVPYNGFDMTPVWRNVFENAGAVQFMHRMTGYLLVAALLWLWLRGRRSPASRTRAASFGGFLMGLIQMGLGILTLLYFVPVSLALLHQLGAVVLFVIILRVRFLARYPLADSIRAGAST